MLIFNVKLNKRKIFKFTLCIMLIICISIGIAALYKVLNSVSNNNLINDSIPSSEIAVLTRENYTNILKQVHDNIDAYIGQKISFSGYVFRIVGFDENQFVLARDMNIGNNQTLIVGFLCSSEKAKEFSTYTWVNITGEITKGNYNNGEIPIIKVTDIEKTEKPENANVEIPDSEFISTAVIY